MPLSAYAVEANAATLAVIREVQKSGVASLPEITRSLEAWGVKTLAGRLEWQEVKLRDSLQHKRQSGRSRSRDKRSAALEPEPVHRHRIVA